MRVPRILTVLALVLCSISVVSAQSLVTVYEHGFEVPVGPEWSDYDRTVTPWGLRTFLGEFSDQPVHLWLDDLAPHCLVRVSFELFIIGSWEGSVGFNAGPDVWDLNVSSGPPNECTLVNLLHTSFANCACDYQAYPANYPNVHNPGLTDADEVNTLGFLNRWGNVEDSVYYLSFTFYHSDTTLDFAFQGSPALEGLNDETWGIDNIRVEMDVDQLDCCRAVRTLPIGWGMGVSIPVSIEVDPNPGVYSYLLEESVPVDWQVSDIDNGGVFFSDTRLIKWGPFFDDVARTFSYSARPPGWATDHTFNFHGRISVDGEEESICGDTAIGPGSYHPADVNQDWAIDGNEVTGYAAAWAVGDPWTDDFHPITAALVANAGFLWKSGESYVFDVSQNPPWVPSGGGKALGGSASRTVELEQGSGSEVRLAVQPLEGTVVYVVEEAPPEGYAVAEISQDGELDEATGRLRWGPFFDDQPRSLSYSLERDDTQALSGTYSGMVSFDGLVVPVATGSVVDLESAETSMVD